MQVNINSCLVEAGVAQWTREEGTGGQGGGEAAVLEVGRVTGGGVSEQQTMLDNSGVRGKVTWLLRRKVLGTFWLISCQLARGILFAASSIGI